MTIEYTLFPFGDDAVVLHLSEEFTKASNQLLVNLVKNIKQNPFPGFIETEASFNIITVHFDRNQMTEGDPFEKVTNWIKQILNGYQTQLETKGQLIEIPVCYHPQLAPDLAEIAHYNRLSVTEFIKLHSDETYVVSYISLGNDIPFLGGNHSKLISPRKMSAGLYSPYGSVGITGTKTGIYPIGANVGWQVIGRAPSSELKRLSPLFTINNEIRFVPISIEEFYKMEKFEDKRLYIS